MVPGGSPPRMKRESGENPGQYPAAVSPLKVAATCHWCNAGKARRLGRVRRPAMTGKGFTPAGENRVAIRYGMP